MFIILFFQSSCLNVQSIGLLTVDTFDENNEKVAFNQFTTFVVGAGNFGGSSQSSAAVPLVDAPTRAPDAVTQEKTTVDQVKKKNLFPQYLLLFLEHYSFKTFRWNMEWLRKAAGFTRKKEIT